MLASPVAAVALLGASACAQQAPGGDTDSYYYLNERFHHVIYEACHNNYLAEQARQLHDRLKPFRRLQLRARSRVATSLTEHQGIVDAILAGDSDRAEQLLRSDAELRRELQLFPDWYIAQHKGLALDDKQQATGPKADTTCPKELGTKCKVLKDEWDPAKLVVEYHVLVPAETKHDEAQKYLEALYRQQAGPVYRYALALSGNAAWAADATQDAFVALAQKPTAFDPTRGSLGAYLAGAARHALLGRWREAFEARAGVTAPRKIQMILRVGRSLDVTFHLPAGGERAR